MAIEQPFQALRVHDDADGYRAELTRMPAAQLSDGDVTIKVAWSSLNYKDALALTGKGKILRRFPLNAGIDAAGYVVESRDPAFREGDQVLCVGAGLGETRDGGYAGHVRLDASAVTALPPGLTLRESMIIGTAGFTAALALLRMEDNGQRPDMGAVVVSGASGGVGMLALDVLARAGYEPHAISGKPEHFDFLIGLGARQCIDRHNLHWGQRPLESARWAGAIDTVGGDMLAGLSRVIHPYGNIGVCGNAASIELATTVMPLILRGVSLLGIASTSPPATLRRRVWEKLADAWKPAHLETIATQQVTLEQLPQAAQTMLHDDSFGRTIVQIE